MGPDVDGIKLAGGSALAVQRQAVVDLIDTAHEHGAYAASAGSLEFVLQKVLYAHNQSHCRRYRVRQHTCCTFSLQLSGSSDIGP